MRIGIVGASSSGLYSALLIKKQHPDFEVHIFDKEEKIGKKLRATGNGHCNLLNLSASSKDFNHSDYLDECFDNHPIDTLLETLASLGVSVLKIGDLVYPQCYSAPSFVDFLSSTAKKMGVIFHMGVRVCDYEGTTLILGSNKEKFDRLVFAAGGASQPNLGSDGSLFSVFKKHGYEICPLRPGLAPIKVVNSVKSLQGVRHDALVKVFQNGNAIFEENGEVLFKKDGLSGIVIFNAQREIEHLKRHDGVVISLNLFPDETLQELTERLTHAQRANPDYYLDSIFDRLLKEEILRELKAKKDPASIAKFVQNWTFRFQESYGFDVAQITLGGIDLSSVNKNLQSTKEKGVFFVGEALDIDGKCGGFNLTWCLMSALIVAEAL